MTTLSRYRRLRRAADAQEGMTLIELAVSMAIMALAATIFISVLWSVQTGVARQQQRSISNDQARLGIQQMDREIRSGNMLYSPTEAFPAPTCGGYACVPGFSVRVYTQANAPTRTPPLQCVQWVIQDRNLLRRAWEPGGTTSLGGWRVVAESIVNRDLPTQVPAFSIDPTSGGRVLDVTLMVNSNLDGQDPPPTTRINTSIAIRNQGSGDPCSPVPSS